MSVLPKLQEIDAALRAGDAERATGMAEAAVRGGLEHPFLFRLTAYALEQQGAFEEACLFLRRGLALSPRDPELLLPLGICLGRGGRHPEAIRVFEQALKLGCDPVSGHYGLAENLASLGRAAEARTAYEKVLALQPDHLQPAANLALLCARTGDLASARRHAEAVLAREPLNEAATLALAAVEVAEKDHAVAEARLQAMAARGDLGPAARGAVLSLLGDALDGLDRPAEAFATYEEANRLLHEAYAGAHAAAAESLAGRLEALPFWLERTPKAAWEAPPPRAPKPDEPRSHVFLVGFPRSGTTLLEQVLDAHPDVVALEEQPTLIDSEIRYLHNASGVEELARLDERTIELRRHAYWARVREAGAEPAGKVLLDKMPFNAANLALICKLFPEAKVLIARRDPRDVVLSAWRRIFNPNAMTYRLLRLEEAADLYATAMTALETARAHMPIDALEVRYERLTTDFDAVTREICAFVGLDWRDEIRAFAEATAAKVVNTPSAAQVKRGIYRDGAGQWRRYALQLRGVAPVLAPWVERLGYERS